MKTFIIIILACSSAVFSGCTVPHLPVRIEFFSEIINPKLKENILGYVSDRIADAKAVGIEDTRDDHIIQLNYNMIGDTIRYKISQKCIGFLVFPTRPLTMTKVDDVYVAIYDDRLTEIQMSVGAIVAFLAKDYPEYIDEYKEYLKRKKLNDGDAFYPFMSFTSFCYEGETWILDFVKGKLVSKTIKAGITGSDETIYY